LRIAKKINTLTLKRPLILLRELGGISIEKRSSIKLTIQTALLISCVIVFSNSPPSFAQNISYDSTGLTIELSDDVQAAIDSGVSLTFENQFALAQNFFFIRWHSKLVQHDFVVTRHSLSNRYLVHESNNVEPNIFSSMHEAMAHIGETALARFSNYHAQQQPHPSSMHKMRLRLSKTKLPGPMRLTAFIAKDWDLDSGWKSWHSDQ